ncbi:ATP-binding protein [Brevibacillus sp. H7]|uniref:ATP-binding protein n=1 Tax=Brevibacillus sp. H7 TaxID=3349138 RepID=UPI00381BD3FE
MLIRVFIVIYVLFISAATVLLEKTEQPILTFGAGFLLILFTNLEQKNERLRMLTLLTLALFHWLSQINWCLPLYIIFAAQEFLRLKTIKKTIVAALLYASLYTLIRLSYTPAGLYHKLVSISDFLGFIAIAFGVSHILKVEMEKRQLMETNQHLITRDPLTGLLNFRECHRQLEMLMLQKRQFVFFLIDCNNLKSQNFELGYVGGNQILVRVAEYLQDAFSECFLLSRYGGDEFAVCLPLDQDSCLLEHYIETLESDFHRKLGVHASYGYGIFPVHGSSKDEIVKYAENMLYTMKRERWLEREQQLLSSEKLRVVGELAAGLAHEIRNPMTTIKGFLQISKSREYNIQPWYDLMMDEISRVNELTSELLQFSKPTITQFTRQSLQELTKRVLSLMESQALFQGHQIILDSAEAPMYAFLERDKMVQVLLNLVKNAFEAMKQPGIITIRLYVDDAWGVIEIQDTGEGIPNDKLIDIFVPFYTTKENGTGLGLVISQKIVQDQGGIIEVESVEHAGSTFRIRLPLQHS